MLPPFPPPLQGQASLRSLVSGGLGEGVGCGSIKAYGQSCPGLPGLVVTSLPSPSPANKSPVCLLVVMETPALPPCRAPGPVLCSSAGSCSLTLQGWLSDCSTLAENQSPPEYPATPAGSGRSQKVPVLLCVYEMGVQECVCPSVGMCLLQSIRLLGEGV